MCFFHSPTIGVVNVVIPFSNMPVIQYHGMWTCLGYKDYTNPHISFSLPSPWVASFTILHGIQVYRSAVGTPSTSKNLFKIPGVFFVLQKGTDLECGNPQSSSNLTCGWWWWWWWWLLLWLLWLLSSNVTHTHFPHMCTTYFTIYFLLVWLKTKKCEHQGIRVLQ